MLRQDKKKSFLFIALLTAGAIGYTQPAAFFSYRGNNFSELSCGGIVYTPKQNKYHQSFGAGAAWVKTPIDLRQPFTVSFVLDYIDTTGEDGSAFVFQTDTNAVGETYNGLGYHKIDQSIGITFDAVKNDYDNDPDFDHISIQANGDLDHNSSNNLAGPLSLESFYEITDPIGGDPIIKFHHLITVTWDPSATLLSVAIDKVTYISAGIDLVQKIFKGNPIVYWGFTGSNTQTVALPPTAEVTFGYAYFFFGDVFPRYSSDPVLDTCFGKAITFSDSSKYNSDYSLQDLSLFKWYWNFGDGTLSTDRNPPAHNYPAPGYYELKFTATNQLGCTTDTLKRIIRLGSKPKPDFSVETFCTNSPIQFIDKTTIEVGIPVAWHWNFGNGIISDDKKPFTSYTTAGIKSVTLSVSSEFGCRADTTKTFPVTDKPVVDFNYIKDCEGNVFYNSSLLNNTVMKEWQWSFGDGFVSNTNQPHHYFSKNNTYTSSLFAVSETGCVSDTVKKNIVINKVYPFAGNDTIIATGQPLQLNASGGTVYSWQPATGLNDTNIDNPIAVLQKDQAYVVSIRNDDGCEGRDTIRIKVYKGPDLYVPSAFTPDHNGLNDVFRVTAPGFKQLDYFRVYDRWGKLVFETRDISKGWDGTLHGVEQSTGVYVWIVKGTDYRNESLFKKGTVTLIR